jgi:uncharacterized protein YdeI (YjbR/CyaY-like superfamily)
MPKTVVKLFEATLERMPSRLNWVIVRIPFDVAKTWGSRGMFRVTGNINGFAFRTSLFPTGRGSHYLLVNKRMQAGGKSKPGENARFHLEPDTEERIVAIPEELERAFSEDRSLRRWFDQLNQSTRKTITDLVAEPKSAETRARRADQMVERLLSAMDAERELPPLLRIAFGRDPLAFKGWKMMTPSHRRGQLLAIFYYQQPGSRARRLAKVMQEARQYAERAEQKKR